MAPSIAPACLCLPAARRKLPLPNQTIMEGAAMITTLFVVKASITPEQEEAFNRWYHTEHCPQLLQFRGVVSARRYKAILGEDRYQYMAIYEFESEATLERFLDSEHFAQLRRGYDASFGDVSERARSCYVQVWP